MVLEGILWIFRTGAPWRDLPPEYGPWSSCYNRFNRWRAKGIWERVWNALKDEIDGVVQKAVLLGNSLNR
ncbi:hypothetical protein SCG7086_AX_00130 [Chlamydiales bacterium SCGC AG-110-P3]|nr:hypothetical protein SCG7086_AX_00130 [Chlamydiales bacterium SCGC AG-110-P3]